MSIQPIILAGGTGSRLWPLSRELYPKQVLSLIGDHSLLQHTLIRLSRLPGVLPPIIVVGEEHRFMIQTQVEELGIFSKFTLLLEPVGKNTAPAICGAAQYSAGQSDEDPVLLVLPADHLISDDQAFAHAVVEAERLASQGLLVTFGITPDHPEIGYGYILKGEANRVERFVEKPDFDTAREYMQSGRYLWNSGMFAFTAKALLQEMGLHFPEIFTVMEQAVAKGNQDGLFFSF